MIRTSLVCLCVFILSACSQEQDTISGSEPQEILERVQNELEQAGEEAESRIDEALSDGDK